MNTNSPEPTNNKWRLPAPATVFLVVILLLLVAFAVMTHFRTKTPTEGILIHTFTSIAAIYASYLAGQRSARESAQEIVRPHARASFRRVTNLYRSLARLSGKIDQLKEGKRDWKLELVQSLVIEQLATGQDAIEDWRDLVPEDVERIEERKPKGVEKIEQGTET